MTQNVPTCLKGPKSRNRRSWMKPRPGVEVRHELVARVRAEIAAGTYDTPQKLEAALECLLARHDLV